MLPYCFRRFGKSSVERSHRIGCRAWRPRFSGRLRLEVLEDRLAPAVYVWTGGGMSNNWSDAANWSGGTPDGDAAAILIFSGTQKTTNTNDIPNLTIQSITFYDPFTIDGMAITLSGGIGTDASTSGNVSFGPDITLSGSPTVTVGNSSSTLTLPGMLSCDAGFTKEGDGTLMVQQAGTYTGTTTLTAGTLEPGASSLGTGTVALDGGTLQFTTDFTNPFTVGDPSHQGILATIASSAGIHITGSGTLSQYGSLQIISLNTTSNLDGNLSGSGAMILTNPGGVVIDGNNGGYSGTVTIKNGMNVEVGSGSALGTGLLILDQAYLTPNVAVTLANPFIVSGASIRGNQNLALTGAGFVASGRLEVENTAGTVSLGALSGPGGLDRAPDSGMGGTLLLTAACTYSGPTGISGGILQLGVPNALPSTTGVSMTGGTLDLNNQDATLNNLSGTAGSVTLGTGILTTGGANNTTFSGSIIGSGGLTKTGSGTFTLAGANHFTGATTVNAGTLNIAGGSDIFTGNITGAGGVTVSGPQAMVTIQGAYNVTGPTTITDGTVLFSRTTPGITQTLQILLINGGTLLVQQSDNLNVITATLNGGTLGGKGTFTIGNSGHLDWRDGTMDDSGMTMILPGGELDLSGVGNRYERNGRQVCNAGNVVWSGSGGVWWTDENASIENESTGSFLQGDSNAHFSTMDDSGTFRNDNGAVFSNAGTTTFDAGVTFSNSGTVVVADTGTLSLLGTFTNFAGGTLNSGTYDILGTFQFNNAAVVTNAATIILDGPDALIIDQDGNDALANLATNAEAGSLTLQNGRNLTTAGAFENDGTLTLGTGLTPGTGSILTVNGDYTQLPHGTGTLSLQFGGSPSSGQFGQLVITGDANLGGKLSASLVNAFIPNLGDSYVVMTFATRSDGSDFDTENLNLGNGLRFFTSYDDNNLTLTATSPRNRPQQRFAEHRETAPVPRIGDGLSGVPWDRNPGRHDGRYGLGNAEVSTRASAEDLDALFACPQQNTPADDVVGNLVHSPFRIHQVIDTSNWSS